MGSLEFMFDKVQRPLSQAQAIPIIGIIPSIAKATISAIQFVVGCILGFLGALGALITFAARCDKATDEMTWPVLRLGAHAGMGLVGLGYSVLNIATLGALGCSIEGRCD